MRRLYKQTLVDLRLQVDQLITRLEVLGNLTYILDPAPLRQETPVALTGSARDLHLASTLLKHKHAIYNWLAEAKMHLLFLISKHKVPDYFEE